MARIVCRRLRHATGSCRTCGEPLRVLIYPRCHTPMQIKKSRNLRRLHRPPARSQSSNWRRWSHRRESNRREIQWGQHRLGVIQIKLQLFRNLSSYMGSEFACFWETVISGLSFQPQVLARRKVCKATQNARKVRERSVIE